jgi:hypothetical protein
VGTEFINNPINPATGCVTRWLGRQRALTTAIFRFYCKIITLGSHASDYVLTSRAFYVDGAIPIVEMVGFCLASGDIIGLIRQATSQAKYQQ